jgi:outer membrane protein W
MSAVRVTRLASFTATLALLASAAGSASAQSGPPAAPGAGPAPTPPPAAPAAPAPLVLEPQSPGTGYPPPPPDPTYYPAYPGGQVYEPPPPPPNRPSGQKRDLIMVAYNTAVGLGDTHDFAPNFSFLGFSFDWRARVTDNFWPGLSLAWQSLYGKEQKTLSYSNTTFTGTIATSLNVFPMLATGNYYFMTDSRGARPYAGLGVGAYAAEHRVDVGIWTISDTSWHFGLAPELGVALPTGRHQLVVSTKFNYGFASGRWDPLMYLNFNVGVEL